MEAVILLVDMLAMVYLCWRIFKAGNSIPPKDDLGMLSYRPEKDAHP